MTTYTVKSGDTLSSIAKAVMGDLNRWREIASLNGLSSTLIRTGQVLQIPDDALVDVIPSVQRVPVTELPHVAAVDDPELIQEITIQARRIDYGVLVGIFIVALVLFSGGKSGR